MSVWLNCFYVFHGLHNGVTPFLNRSFLSICMLFLSHVNLLPQFDSGTDFHECESSVSKKSAFQVIQSNKATCTLL